MNIVFWLVVIIAMVLLWFLLSFAFKGVGRVGWRLFNSARREIQSEDSKNERNIL